MVNAKTKQVFKDHISHSPRGVLAKLGNGTDEYYLNIPSDVRNAVRTNFGLDIAEDILMVRDTSFWDNRDQGLVITDWGIHCIPDNDNPDQGFAFPWEIILNVEYKDENYYFYDNTDQPYLIHQGFFFKDEDIAHSVAIPLCNMFKALAKSQEYRDANSIFQSFNELVFNESITPDTVSNKALELKDSGVFNDYGICLILTRVGRKWFNEIFNARFSSLPFAQQGERKNQCIEKALKWLKDAESWINDDTRGDLIGEIEWVRCLIMRQNNENVESMRRAIKALGESTNEDDKNLLREFINCKGNNGGPRLIFNQGYGIIGESIEEMRRLHEADRQNDLKDAGNDVETLEYIQEEHEYWLEQFEKGEKFFSHRPYQERQFIFVVRDIDHIAGCYDASDNIKYVFPIDQLPGDISFPMGHPQPDTLYYAHPLRPLYLPAQTANKDLFFEKIQEYSRLIQCLGATRITLRCIKGRNISEGVNALSNIDGKVETWAADANASYTQNHKTKTNQTFHDELSETKYYTPTSMPYCPPDLFWAALDPEMNSLTKQRLEGGLTHVSRKVSSRETMNVTSNRMQEVHATFDHFMATVSAHYNAKTDTTFSEVNETIWEIEADFMPLNEYGQANAESPTPAVNKKEPSLTIEEEQYLEEFKFILEDGEITDRERRALERLRLKLNLPSERVFELESLFMSKNLTEEEATYVKEYNLECAEGEIGDRERRRLNRLRDSLGISEERATALEKSQIQIIV